MNRPLSSESPRDDLAPSKVDRLVAILEQALRTGRFVAGDRFLSSYEVARDYGVSAGTARKAMGELVARGYLQNAERSGFFLRPAGAELSKLPSPPSTSIIADATDTLLVIVGTIADGGHRIFEDYIVALQQAARLHGWQVVHVSNTADDITRVTRQCRVVGCLAYCLHDAPAAPIELTSTIVWNRWQDWHHPDCSILSVDANNAARLAYEHLWDLGHLKTAHVRLEGPPTPNINATGMILGMRKAYYSLGHHWTPDDVIVVKPRNIASLYEDLCAAGITGICCDTWDIAAELYRQAARHKQPIGQHLTLVTVGGHDNAQALQPAPSRICWRAIDFASTIIEAIVQRTTGKPMPRMLYVPVFLEEGATTRSMFNNNLHKTARAVTAG